MRYRLRPVRPRHRSRLRLTLATLLLPLLAIVVLSRQDASRAPLAEREAALAIDLRQPRAGEPEQVRDAAGKWTAPAMAAVSRMPRLAGNRELQLRLAGMCAGALALGVAVRLGTRLFAPRVGLLSAVLLLALPAGRRLLGTELSVEPFFLLAMLSALLAIRSMVEARITAVFAGIASGLALALGGLDGAWLPVMALAWLRFHQGLNARSASVVVGTTVASAAAALLVGWAVATRGATLLPDAGSFAFLDPALLRPVVAARELLPLAPLLVIGLAIVRREWWRSEPFRFLFLWLVLAAASFAATGAAAAAYVALVFLVSAVVLLGLEHAAPRWSLPACGVAAGIAVAIWRVSPVPSEAQALERWAIREAGRFVGRVIAPDRRIAANERAAKRFTYYGNREVEALAGDAPLASLDYVIVPRDDFRVLREQRANAGGPHAPRLRRVAEFGSWVVARVAEPPSEAWERPPHEVPGEHPSSSFVRPANRTISQ